MSQRTILVTSALPYANNSLHLGHVLGYVQTDIWVRFQRLRGHRCWYVCASDAHGTPTMLRAEQEGIAPETLIERVSAEHRRDFATYRISVDNYLTTHSPENEELTTELYRRLAAGGFIGRKTIKQAYDEERQMFLPDRYVRGTCPICGTAGSIRRLLRELRRDVLAARAQGRRLDVVRHAADRARIRAPVPEAQRFRGRARVGWPSTSIAVLARKLDEWFKTGLKDWDISRDAPYFGFRIPGERDKFFYVWFDAPIGYMASFLNLCRREGLDFDEFWGAGQPARALPLHRQGHPVLPRAVLARDALGRAATASRAALFVHGHVTVDGQKMSKRRGNFITAGEFASNSTPTTCATTTRRSSARRSTISISNLADFVAKVNADLVGKLVNIASRCAGFVHKLNGGRLAATLPEPALYAEFAAAADDLAADFEQREYARAVRKIMALADRANQYIDERKPWILAKHACGQRPRSWPSARSA